MSAPANLIALPMMDVGTTSGRPWAPVGGGAGARRLRGVHRKSKEGQANGLSPYVYEPEIVNGSAMGRSPASAAKNRTCVHPPGAALGEIAPALPKTCAESIRPATS